MQGADIDGRREGGRLHVQRYGNFVDAFAVYGNYAGLGAVPMLAGVAGRRIHITSVGAIAVSSSLIYLRFGGTNIIPLVTGEPEETIKNFPYPLVTGVNQAVDFNVVSFGGVGGDLYIVGYHIDD